MTEHINQKHIVYLCANMSLREDLILPNVIKQWETWSGTPGDLLYLAGYLHGAYLIGPPYVQYEQYITLGAASNLALMTDSKNGLQLVVIKGDGDHDQKEARLIQDAIDEFLITYRTRSITWGSTGEELSWWTKTAKLTLESINHNSSISNKEES